MMRVPVEVRSITADEALLLDIAQRSPGPTLAELVWLSGMDAPQVLKVTWGLLRNRLLEPLPYNTGNVPSPVLIATAGKEALSWYRQSHSAEDATERRMAVLARYRGDLSVYRTQVDEALVQFLKPHRIRELAEIFESWSAHYEKTDLSMSLEFLDTAQNLYESIGSSQNQVRVLRNRLRLGKEDGQLITTLRYARTLLENDEDLADHETLKLLIDDIPALAPYLPDPDNPLPAQVLEAACSLENDIQPFAKAHIKARVRDDSLAKLSNRLRDVLRHVFAQRDPKSAETFAGFMEATLHFCEHIVDPEVKTLPTPLADYNLAVRIEFGLYPTLDFWSSWLYRFAQEPKTDDVEKLLAANLSLYDLMARHVILPSALLLSRSEVGFFEKMTSITDTRFRELVLYHLMQIEKGFAVDEKREASPGPGNNDDREEFIKTSVRNQLLKEFSHMLNTEALKTVSFLLKVQYDNLRGEGKDDKLRELIMLMEHTDRIKDLKAAVRETLSLD